MSRSEQVQLTAEEELAAITAAITLVLSRRSVKDSTVRRVDATSWRFSTRWWNQPAPVLRGRPWTTRP
ncbi:MAG: hypothetical protein ACP5PJ_02895 [Acidimicrobiales bacterium]